jgi:transcription-repair coupling factor (superfamily II helicase)
VGLVQPIEGQAASTLFARIRTASVAQDLIRRLEAGRALSLNCVGVAAGAQPFLAVWLHEMFPDRPILLVSENLKAQEMAHQDVGTWLAQTLVGRSVPAHTLPSAPPSAEAPSAEVVTRDLGGTRPVFFPSWEILPQDTRLPHLDVISERLEALIKLNEAKVAGQGASVEVKPGESPLSGSPTEADGKVRDTAASQARAIPAVMVTASVVALLERTFTPAEIQRRTRRVRRAEQIDPLDLVKWLEEQGYEPEAQVTQKGEIALRGGILDVFPLTSPWPVRLEFFGDELESLRYFDPLTQISREAVEEISLPPAGELGVLKRQLTGEGEGKPESLVLATVLDHLPPSAILVLCEPDQLELRAAEYASQISAGDPFFIAWHEFLNQAAGKGMAVVRLSETPLLGEPGAEGAPRADLSFDVQSLDAFRPVAERAPEPQVAETQRREFFEQLHRWLRQEYEVHVFCNNEGERQRFAEIWEEYGLSGTEGAAERPQVHLGTLSRGFLNEATKTVVITDAEIFGRYRVQRPRRLKSAHAQTTRSALDIDFTELEEGDYVVHLQHGIGRYLGLQALPAGLGTKPMEGTGAAPQTGEECLAIEYAPTDSTQPAPKLYVPVTEAHLVSKYVGTGKARPPLNTLGGTRWAKAKAHAERAVRDVAGELLSIQAARESQAGHPFKLDTPWQREFEGAFIFEETPDQMRAIVETKSDMERPKPMDRLICGDVGFGKTEVGIRAAFKAVMEGKQVAVLVPTTVLAQQHYNTFRERMSDYPIRVELLSRFRTRGQQQAVVRDLATGSVDIVIGTHRLVQPDIAFKDLGLVVIDEEQRFGVLHKEKFKMLRQLVDVLTLSATPIPRTLYLALTGARDMSTIQTPPHDRLPVETIVTQYDERVIRDAIQRELNRGGQVFFLHNRVMTIQAMAAKLRDLVPQARLAVGHGQMHADDLEEVMTQFVNGEADVLLSTTIIESGLDIPNANTIIIDRADRFGLSDLYQLRGRVGRYKHQAYAYLLLPRHAGLLADVRKRLSAIKQYSTLGSGFKIAMRDLEIRGAGNLLGAEQSGHITAVGFELYCQLLKQSVSALKGETVKPRVEVQVRLDFLSQSPLDDITPPEPRRKGKSTSGSADLEAAKPSASSTRAGRPAMSAHIPIKYISDPRQRIEVYRKLAQATDKASLQSLQQELRDRFGPCPPALELLLQVVEIKGLAAERLIHSIEVKEDKVMLSRGEDFIMMKGKFPRLVKKETGPRLRELKKLLMSL